jgi:hypothetical protein
LYVCSRQVMHRLLSGPDAPPIVASIGRRPLFLWLLVLLMPLLAAILRWLLFFSFGHIWNDVCEGDT